MPKPDPISLLQQWLAEAERHPQISEPTAMCLATADAHGQPSARMVLLKGLDKRGLVFYSNKESRKGEDLLANPRAALCFYWMPLGKQLRVEGEAKPVSAAEADAYFATRPRESQVGAWASAQSRPLEHRDVLLRCLRETEEHFAGRPVPRPEFWGGWRLAPERFEFWRQGEFRLHAREVFSLKDGGWEKGLLYP